VREGHRLPLLQKGRFGLGLLEPCLTVPTDCLIYLAPTCSLSSCIPTTLAVRVGCRMGKVPVRLKEVVYTVSPFEVKIMSTMLKEFPYKLQKHIRDVRCTSSLNNARAQGLFVVCVFWVDSEGEN
jgi:Cytochrome b-c1 complex subunit 8